ncbi:MAG: hypothetical protein K8F91_11260, partial [Candidatus Obscuribacterales bacterium]|nr:hypothetical protein [Candidatus Obscuribacterales bacterium]
SKKSPKGSVCIWPEWSYLVTFSKAFDYLKSEARLPASRKQSWILGCIDKDKAGNQFNSVCAMDREKGLIPTPYHKRYLVPFGEFTPDWVRQTPLAPILYGFNKNYDEATADKATVVFPLTDIHVGPLLCFECLMPGLSVDNVRNGAGLLVDCSNTGWFEKSILSDQMVAFCVMRAAENHRSLVFATTLGPSTIIDSTGRIVRQAPREEAAIITADVPIEEDITPYTRYCF